MSIARSGKVAVAIHAEASLRRSNFKTRLLVREPRQGSTRICPAEDLSPLPGPTTESWARNRRQGGTCRRDGTAPGVLAILLEHDAGGIEPASSKRCRMVHVPPPVATVRRAIHYPTWFFGRWKSLRKRRRAADDDRRPSAFAARASTIGSGIRRGPHEQTHHRRSRRTGATSMFEHHSIPCRPATDT